MAAVRNPRSQRQDIPIEPDDCPVSNGRSDPVGIRIAAVSRWLAANVEGVAEPVSFSLKVLKTELRNRLKEHGQ